MKGRKLHSVHELLILRAAYNQKLNRAIKEGDRAKVKDYVANYGGEDRSFYDMKESIDITRLQQMLSISEKEFNQAFATGRYIMGM